MNARIYGMMLRLYPAELRHAFGAEMTEVFLEDLASGRPTRVWWCSLKELFRIALPAALSHRYVVVPALLYLLQALYMGSVMIWVPRDRVPHSIEELVVLATLPGLASAVMAFVALYIGDRAVPEPLNLR
jgi:hypothetical protein